MLARREGAARRSSAARAGPMRRTHEHRALRRAVRPAGRDLVPPGVAVRRRSSALCRRSRHRAEPGPEGAHRERRPHPADRRPHVGDAVARPTRCSTSRRREQKLVHVHPGSEELGRVYQPALAIQATPAAFAAARRDAEAAGAVAWTGEAAEAHADYLAWTEQAARAAGHVPVWRGHDLAARPAAGGRDRLQRRRQLRRLDPSLSTASAASRTQLAPTSGSMGYGVPAAVLRQAAVSRSHRRRLRRRRLLPDERPGIRDRRAVRRCR